MFKLIDLYRRSQRAQLNWIRTHPILYITLNVVLAAIGFAWVLWQDRTTDYKYDMPANTPATDKAA